MLLQVLLAVVLAEINQMKNVHFPLGSVLFFYDVDDDELMLNVLRCHETY